jgi:hypothetical protein
MWCLSYFSIDCESSTTLHFLHDRYEANLDQANIIFTIIFTVECGIKILALGPWEYVFDAWNFFDFVVVVMSLVDLIMGAGGNVSSLRCVAWACQSLC